MQVTHAKSIGKPDGADGSFLQPSDWNDEHVIVGGGAPLLVQAKTSGLGNTALTLTLDAAPTAGNILVLASFSNGGAGLSTVVQTNVTWTKMVTGTAISATKMEIWIGVVAGSAGTLITITRAGGNAIWSVIELDETATPTLGQTIDTTEANPAVRVPGAMAATTAGRLIVFAGGGVSQNQPFVIAPSLAVAGIPIAMCAVAAGYSLGERVYLGGFTADGAGGALIACEVS